MIAHIGFARGAVLTREDIIFLKEASSEGQYRRSERAIASYLLIYKGGWGASDDAAKRLLLYQYCSGANIAYYRPLRAA